LNGTKRQQLLREGKISEREISVDSLGDYDRIYLINAMLDIEDGISLSVSSIYQ
jgi:4-amino-4-deoxychorismate lyase